MKVDHHVYAYPQGPLYFSQGLLLHVLHHLRVQLWVVLCVGEHQLFSLGVEIRPHAQEVYCLDEAFVGEENAEIGNVESFPKLFPGDQGEYFGLENAFQLFGEDSHQISDSFYEVGMVDALHQERVHMETGFLALKRPKLTEVVTDYYDRFVHLLHFEALG